VTTRGDYALRGMDVELSPEQPAEVAEVVARLVGTAPAAPDPWWQAGIEEALET